MMKGPLDATPPGFEGTSLRAGIGRLRTLCPSRSPRPGWARPGCVRPDSSRADRIDRRAAPQPADHQAQHDQPDLVEAPAGGGEEAVSATVMPHRVHPRPGEHPAHRAPRRHDNQTGEQRGERSEPARGETRPERPKYLGYRPRKTLGSLHRRTCSTLCVPETLSTSCHLLVFVERPPMRSCRWILRMSVGAWWGSGAVRLL